MAKTYERKIFCEYLTSLFTLHLIELNNLDMTCMLLKKSEKKVQATNVREQIY